MERYQKRSDYKGSIKKDADKFYKGLKALKDDYKALKETPESERKNIKIALKLLEIHEYYESWDNSKLYNEFGGLYCTILEDANK